MKQNTAQRLAEPTNNVRQEEVVDRTVKRTGNRGVFLHVGLHRTGTTFLQTKVFRRFANVHYYHKPSHAQWRQLEADADSPLLLSHEGFLLKKKDGRIQIEQLERLAGHFPDAACLLALWRPDQWFRSLYAYRALKGEHCDFPDFVQQRKQLSYLECIDALERVFGTTPHVIFLEELRDAPDATIESIANWIGTPAPSCARPTRRINRSRSNQSLTWPLQFNRRFPRPKRPASIPHLLHLKAHEAFIHGLGFANAWLDPEGGRSVIPPSDLEAVRRHWEYDWMATLHRVAAQRALLSPALEQERHGSAVVQPMENRSD